MACTAMTVQVAEGTEASDASTYIILVPIIECLVFRYGGRWVLAAASGPGHPGQPSIARQSTGYGVR